MLQKTYPRSVTFWLFTCAAFIIVMVAIGGLTRLTNSGLSITSWKPITGWIPPLSEVHWQQEFEAYQLSPEFQKINSHFTLSEFKSIFWLEFIHRVLGRLVGIIVFFPLLYFAFKKYIDKALIFKLSGIFILGALQGVVGWYMVRSGLKDLPYVNHLWLSSHLLMASIIFALLFWLALYSANMDKYRYHATHTIRLWANLLPIVVFIQIGLGGLVAGMDAGLIYNSFPTMDGEFIPQGLFFLEPWYDNFLHHATMVQFEHRVGAMVVLLVSILFFCKMHVFKLEYPLLWRLSIALLVMVIAQFTLGVATLLLHVPVPLASLHQVMALIVFAIALLINYIA